MLSNFFLDRPVFAWVIAIILMLAGGLSIYNLPISHFAGEGKGGATLGFLNSGRFMGNAVAPMMATTLLAQFNMATHYLAISGLTVAMFCAFMASMRTSAQP